MGAYVLIGIGVFGLLAGTGVLKLIGGLFGGLVLAALAYFAYNEGRRNRNTLWRVAPYPLAGLAIAAIVPAGLGAGAFLAGLGLAFAVAWRDDQTRWWALIRPALWLRLEPSSSSAGSWAGTPRGCS